MMQRRSAGVLLHVTSLPSPYGIGDMGPWAYRFVDFLRQTGQSLWQVLPLNPPNIYAANSPYSCESIFAGNPLLVSPEELFKDGLLTREEIEPPTGLPQDKVDYRRAVPAKMGLLDLAWRRFSPAAAQDRGYQQFCVENASWVDDFALFKALTTHMPGLSWSQWPLELRDRQAKPLQLMREQLRDETERHKVYQYLFHKQWDALRKYANRSGVRVIGDVAMFVSYDSADVWDSPQSFKLDKDKRPVVIAGHPPDHFNRKGQLWGNPVYAWDAMKRNGYRWWLLRMEQAFKLFDVVRVDHFRGFVAHYEVSASDMDPAKGSWVAGPNYDLFNAMHRRFGLMEIIPESLGRSAADVVLFLHDLNLPEMRVLLFGFWNEAPQNLHAPHNFKKEMVAYTSNHDVNTVRGWFEHQATERDKDYFFRYVGRKVAHDEVSREFIRLLMRSVADRTIVPLQDILNLGQEARMNVPGTVRGNWEWRFMPEQLTGDVTAMLAEMTDTYNRSSMVSEFHSIPPGYKPRGVPGASGPPDASDAGKGAG